MESTAQNIKTALGAEFAGILSDNPAELVSYSTSNPLAQVGEKPVLVAKPENAERLAALVRAANKHGFHIVPVSSKGAHKHGGLACAKPHVIVDLSGWKKNGFVDRRNRVAMIEPGTTYGELVELLSPHGMTAPIPLAPRSGKSVLAAMMDRTPSTWPKTQWDIGDPVASTELVFGTGDIFKTGAAGGPGSFEKQRASGGALKSPVGPSQTDFHRVVQGSQGSMCIATWVTIRAEMKPTVESTKLLVADSPDKLAAFVYPTLRSLLGEQCFILNRAALSMLMGGSKIDTAGEYVCVLNVAGFDRLPKERLAYQLADLDEIATQSGLKLEDKSGSVAAADILKKATTPCGETDWRFGAKGHCLSVFFLSTLDRANDMIAAFSKAAEGASVKPGEIGVYIQPVVQNHGCHFEFMVPFDPSNGESVEKMKKLEREAVNALKAKGAFFSRPYGAARDVFDANPLNKDLLSRIKGIFDPNGVLSPLKFGY